MKKEIEINLGELFLAINIIPAALLAAIFFFATSNFWGVNEGEAAMFSYNFLFWTTIISGLGLILFAPESNNMYIPLVAVVLTGLAVVSLIFCLSNTVVLAIGGGVGIISAFGFAHYLQDGQTDDFKVYMFILISLLLNCLVDGTIYLVLTSYFKG